MPRKKSYFAEYVTGQIKISEKTQRQIADEMGYDNANIITLFKQGLMKMPLNKVPLFAKALGLDTAHVFRLAIREYAPNLLDVIEHVLASPLVTKNEVEIIKVIRDIVGNSDPAVTTDLKARLKKVFES